MFKAKMTAALDKETQERNKKDQDAINERLAAEKIRKMVKDNTFIAIGAKKE
jgi:hypothetical protein